MVDPKNTADSVVDSRLQVPLEQLSDPFRLFVDHQVDLICAYQPDGTIIYANISYASFFGTTPGDLLGTPIVDLATDHNRQQAQENLAETVSAFGDSNTPTVNEFSLKDSQGERRWIEWTDQPAYTPEGELIIIVAVGRDVSARHEANEKLSELNQRLAESNRDLQDFAYVASHDLQEPLRKIIAFSNRLSTKAAPELSEKNLDYLERISGAAGRMQNLIDDLLEVSRVATRGTSLVPVDLNEVIADVLSDLEVAIERSGAIVSVNATLPKVPADETQMRQLFQNLISNAVKFQTPGSTPEVTIDAEPVPPDELPPLLTSSTGSFVRVTVADNGIGFDEKHAASIFTIFHRLHGRNEYEGSGIGLSVCKKILDRHNGHIAARSAPGEGATFDVTLPVA